MKTLIFTVLMLFSAVSLAADCPAWLQQDMQKLRSQDTVNLCELSKDKVVLIVNTASKCGFTKQFEDLETLYQRYKDKGFVIIGFPSDSFKQELDDAEDIATVCYVNYGVTFPMMASSPVRGKQANPVFQHLNATLDSPSWNFNKYLIDRNGKAMQRFGSRTKPLDSELTGAIEQLLPQTP